MRHPWRQALDQSSNGAPPVHQNRKSLSQGVEALATPLARRFETRTSLVCTEVAAIQKRHRWPAWRQ
jgi:hypothetical protein